MNAIAQIRDRPQEGIHNHEEPSSFCYHLVEKMGRIVRQIFDSIWSFFYQTVHKLIGFVVLPSQNRIFYLFENLIVGKESLIARGGESIQIQTDDGLVLDGMYFQGKNCNRSSRTVILFNANGIRYEEYGLCKGLLDLKMWEKKEWNVVVFNYRGVGDSRGVATLPGLVEDGSAVLKYVQKMFNVPLNQILLHGHSLGGGIASEVAALYPDVNYCNDRSFSSLSQQAAVMLGNGFFGKKMSEMMVGFGWEIRARDNWDKIKGKKVAISHHKDAVIPKEARFSDSALHAKEAIHLKSSWIPLKFKNSTIYYPDDAQLVEDYIHAHQPKDLEKLQLNRMKQKAGVFAHMRLYTQVEREEYFCKFT